MYLAACELFNSIPVFLFPFADKISAFCYQMEVMSFLLMNVNNSVLYDYLQFK